MADAVSNSVSNLARKFEFLQDRAQRKPIREATVDIPGDVAKKTNISHLKEFYLQRLAKNEPGAAARLGVQLGSSGGDAVQPQASGQQIARPTFSASAASAAAAAAAPAVRDLEDLEIMCNNCFNLIKSSEASSCTGDPRDCPTACRSGATGEKPSGAVGLLDLKLKRLRAALESRLQDSSSKVNVMRHLTQLRYHIDTAIKWVPGCPEIGALSDHTVVQVKQLTATSRVLAPAVYIFSKRIENVVVQKERELRRLIVQQSTPTKSQEGGGSLTVNRDEISESVAELNSIVSELDSDCGTQYAETLVTQQEGSSNDVGNVQDANEYLSLKNEDEQRRWFYSQCLTVKLACPDKNRAKKILISDLYAKVKTEGVPIEGWVQWIRSHLMPDEDAAAASKPAAATSEQGKRLSAPIPPGSINLPVREAIGAGQASAFMPPSRTSAAHYSYGQRP